MPPAETIIREAVERNGWKLRILGPLSTEDGSIEVRIGVAVRLFVVLPRTPRPGYDPWDTLLQACYRLTDPHA